MTITDAAFVRNEANLKELSGAIVDSALKVHRILGPGLLESAYEHCLAFELSRRGFEIKRQVILPIEYEGETLEVGYRLDLLVEEKIVVEIKSVEKLMPLHEAQLLTYLKLSRYTIGLLMNFNVTLLKLGLKRLRLDR